MDLIRYDTARRALAEAAAIDEVKDVADKAQALELYARQHRDTDLEIHAAEIKARAARRIGELSKALDKTQGEHLPNVPASGSMGKTAALKAAGLSTSKANRFEAIADLPEEDFEGYIARKKDQGKPVKITEVEAAALANRREKNAKEALQAAPPILPEGLRIGDFRDHAAEIPDESIELIFTDPPYDRDAIPLFGDLAKEAARVLRPGGSLIAYCGHIQLPEVLGLMSGHLRYWWVNACLHAGTASRMNKYGIKVTWKPMVWFVKGSRGDVQTMLNDSVSGGQEKEHHAWQQSQAEAEYYIERLCSPGGVVWDPFAGGGTTLAACEALGRKWIASEMDELAAANIAKRLQS